MKNKFSSIGLILILVSIGMFKDTVEIELHSVDDYKKLTELGIELKLYKKPIVLSKNLSLQSNNL